MTRASAGWRQEWLLVAAIVLISATSLAAQQENCKQDQNAPGCTPQTTAPSGGQAGNQAQPPVEPQTYPPANPPNEPQTYPPTTAPGETQGYPRPNIPKPSQPISSPPKVVELTDFQRLVATSSGRVLPIYGASLFENVPTTFAPVDRVPVTSDYVLGPGDELLIRAWGQIDLDVRARVDRSGNVFLPKVGSLNVAGLKYAQLEQFLRSHVGRIYQNFDLSVAMGELRSIDVYVVGQARRPGRYTVSSLSTLSNAIFASGGPSPTGSMRHIQLKRGSQVVTDFDLYDLLLNGDKSKDVVLQPEDVIYIASVGPQVAVGGQVNVPAIYELKTEATLAEALRLAGGLSVTADGGKVLVEHINGRQTRSVEEIALDATGMSHPVKDGDFVNITPLSPRFENSVTLRGNVATPGRYPWHENMRVGDLIPNREFLITRDYWKQQNALALEATVGAHVSGAQNDVRRNAPEINWDYAVIQRMSPEDLSTQIIPFNLGKAILSKEDSNNLILRAGDIVTIFSQADLRVPEGKQTKLVRLEGEFNAAGVYRAKPTAGLRDLVVQAGGMAPSAYLYAAEFTRESVRVEQQERLDLMIAQTERAIARQAAVTAQNARSADEVAAAKASSEAQQANLDKLRRLKANGRIVLNIHPDDKGVDSIPDLPLEDGDQFYVPPRPIVVSVVGDVYNQGSFIQQPGKTVSNYLRSAGGPTRQADKGRIFVVRANGAVVSKDASSKFWAGGFDTMVMMPGDTVVVPEQTNPGSFMRSFKDWSQILFNFGLAAAAINILK
jgi:polysaccharide export outer membrane protein